MRHVISRGLLALPLIAYLYGCGPSDQGAAVTDAPRQPPAQSEPQKYKDFGDYVIHFNAMTTADLPADVARGYGITRSGNRAMLNVVILKKEPGTTGRPVRGSVAARATNLTGQLKNLQMREIAEDGGENIYYLGETTVSNAEVLIYTIDVTPINETSRFSVT
jgi:hypothetical protein